MHRSPRLLVLALIAAACVPASASADGWSPAAPISPAGASSPSAAADGSGGVTAAWVRGGVVEAAQRGAFGTFGEPQPLSGTGSSLARIASNAAGRAVVIWVRDGIVQASIRPDAAAPFGPAQDVSSAGVGAQPRAGVDGAGNVTVAWVRGGLVELVRRDAGAATWPAPQSFAENEPDHVALAVAPNGAATAVWSVRSGGYWSVRTAVRLPGAAAFGAPVMLEEEADDIVGNPVAADVAVDATGRATAVWPNHLQGMYRNPVIRAAERTATGAFSAPETISDDAVNDRAMPPRPHVAVNAAGDALSVWNDRVEETNELHVARRVAGASFEAHLTAAGPDVDPDQDPAVAVDPQGRGVALWVQGGRVRAARMTGGLGEPASLSAAGATKPQVVVDAGASAVAAWVRDGRVEAATYDVGSPTLSGVEVPATALAGERVVLAAAAADRESAATVEWSFGDGATASGASVEHRFAAPGTYDVRVRAVDGGGNAVTETRKIVVAPFDDRRPPNPCGFCSPPLQWMLRDLAIAPSKVRAGRAAQVTFRLAYANRVVFTIERRTTGKRRWRKLAGSFAVAGKAGANRVRFSGRLAGRKLRPGSHRLVAKVDGWQPVRTTFRVVRPGKR